MSGKHSPQFADCCGICGNKDSVSFSNLRKFLAVLWNDDMWFLTSEWTDIILTVCCLFLRHWWVFCIEVLYSFQGEFNILGLQVNLLYIPENFSYNRWTFWLFPGCSYNANFHVQNVKPSLHGCYCNLSSTSCDGLWRMLSLPWRSRPILWMFPYYFKNYREKGINEWSGKSLAP